MQQAKNRLAIVVPVALLRMLLGPIMLLVVAPALQMVFLGKKERGAAGRTQESDDFLDSSAAAAIPIEPHRRGSGA